MPLGAFKLNGIAKYIVSGAPPLGDYGLWKVLDNPNAYGTSAGDTFGRAVAICENYTIIGNYVEDDATNIASNAGKAYIYSNSTGSLVYTLNNPNAYATTSGDLFGSAVAINNDYAVVSASSEDDAGGADSGKVYIFSTATGSLVYTLNNPNAYSTSAADQFGESVAISNSHVIIGARNEDDAGGALSGKAYIYELSTGSLVYTLDNPNAYDTSANDQFGFAVAISDNYAIVGAYAEDDAGGTGSGKAYIYSTSTGSLVYTLDNPNAYSTSVNDSFGSAVAINNNYAIVGAYLEDDAGGSNSGKAYIYSTSTGSLVYTLDNPNAYGTSASDNFGYKVAISDSYAIVGAYTEDDAGGNSSGKAYIYELSTGSLVYTLDNPNPYAFSVNDSFGFSVGITDTHAIIGAHNSNDAGSGGLGSGTAFLYNRNELDHITVSNDGIAYAYGAQSTASTITIPAGVVAGDLLVLFDTSTTTTLTVPSGWTQISTATTTGIRTTVSYRIAATGALGGNTVTGMAGTTRKVMLVYRNTATGSITVGTISTPSAQATTAAPSNQTITGGTKPCIYFACHSWTSTNPTRTWTGLPGNITQSALSSISTSGIEARHLMYDSGVNENALVNATISQTDGGTNAMISFRMNVS